MKFKKSAIILGIFMGCAGVFGGMVMKNHSSEAAVAVWDEKNIAEAVKTVLNTTNILTEEQKKIALELLNMKSLDPENLLRIMQRNANRQDQFWNEKGSMDGVMAAKKNIPQTWDEAFGNIDLLLDGNVSPQDLGKITSSTIRILDKTNKDAANAARVQQEKLKDSNKNVQKLLEDSQKVEGEVQAQQVGHALQGENVYAIHDGNTLISHIATMQATEMQARNARAAQDEARSAASIAGMVDFAQAVLGR